MYFDEDGKFLGTLGEKEIEPSVYYELRKTPAIAHGRRPWVHGMHVDSFDNVWITDVGRHIVMKFTPDGELALTLGEPDRSGETETLLNQPTHAVVIPNGEIFVADGYGNSRIVKFSPKGKFLQAWGKPGTAPGEFQTPHVLAFDSPGKLYVSDRENNRIQVFDTSGQFLAIYRFYDCVNGIFLANDGSFYFVGGETNFIIQRVTRQDEILQSWTNEPLDGNPHWVWHDGKQYLYIANANASCVSKYQVIPE